MSGGLIIQVPRPGRPLKPATSRRQRSKEPQPFPRLIRKPLGEACEQEADARPNVPDLPPPLLTYTRGRRRTVDTHTHVCPAPDCSYDGWCGRGNIRAHGHPGGQPGRQLQCGSGCGYCSETHGHIFHGQRYSLERIGRVIAGLAEGLGIRGTARVFAIEPNTVPRLLGRATTAL
jgi:hypothetical protein